MGACGAFQVARAGVRGGMLCVRACRRAPPAVCMTKRPRIRSARAGQRPAPRHHQGEGPTAISGRDSALARARSTVKCCQNPGQIKSETRSDKIRTGGQMNRNPQARRSFNPGTKNSLTIRLMRSAIFRCGGTGHLSRLLVFQWRRGVANFSPKRFAAVSCTKIPCSIITPNVKKYVAMSVLKEPCITEVSGETMIRHTGMPRSSNLTRLRLLAPGKTHFRIIIPRKYAAQGTNQTATMRSTIPPISTTPPVSGSAKLLA